MRIFNLFSRHSGFATLASAYADGELRGADLRQFETHMANCDACMTAVTQARQLKSAVARLPVATAPRSFRITPAMAREPVKQAARTPLYLGLARAGAALSVLAFVSVLAFGALDSESGSDGDADSATARQASGDMEAASGSGPEKTAQDSFATSAAAPTPALAPSSGGGVGSSGIPTPEVPATGPRTSDSGAATPPPLAEDNTDSAYSDPGVVALATDTPASAKSGEKNDGPQTVLLVLGGLAAAMVVLLISVETFRRTRRT